ncbi:hypothetical protein [Salinigranum sp. GCM10025319]|uniref:hypothetical protein n=1 Tax=Salinigranum sp. GCM10025319 TaxID=3252687 RepID=UPI0036141C1E
MPRSRTASLLVGRNSALALRYLLVAVGLFVATIGLWGVLWGVTTAELTLTWPLRDFRVLVAIFAGVSVGSATVHAYTNRGLFVSWALGSAVPLGLYVVPTASGSMPPDETVLWGIGSGLLFGIPLGTLGFLLGVVLHRAVLFRNARQKRTDARS